MMQHPDFEQTDLSRLRIAGVGGAPCALTIMEAWAGRGVLLVQGFGMTETSPACIFLDPGDALRKIGSTGKALLHTEMRIVDDEGRDCGPNEIGELWVAGPHITPGYWNRPDATAAAFEGRWLKTGDAARADDEGFVYIVDRWKDMYISGGENVYPAEIENVLYQLPEVAEAAIIGVPNDKWGEVGLAVLALKPGATIDRATVVEHCVSRLAKFKIPNDIAIVDVAAAQRDRQGAQARAAHAVPRCRRSEDLLTPTRPDVQAAGYGRRDAARTVGVHDSRRCSGVPDDGACARRRRRTRPRPGRVDRR